MRLIGLFAIVSITAGLHRLEQARAADVATPGDLPVLLSVNVPEAAEIWVDGYHTNQRGAFREFISPPLPAGREFTYTIQVKANGKKQAQTVKVRAGDRVNLDFREPGYSAYYGNPVPALSAPRFVQPVEQFDPWRVELQTY